MPRRSLFKAPSHEPFAQDPNIQLKEGHTSGPFSFFNPTRARFHVPATASVTSNESSESDSKEGVNISKDSELSPGFEFRWRSRDNRKGRHTLVIDPAAVNALGSNVVLPSSTSTFRATLHGIWRMFTVFPIWDVSYLIAQFFTWGSVIFVLNGLFYFLPVAAPSTNFTNEGPVGGGITAFIGTIFYEIGVVLLMFEAFNENRTGCFGWALEKAVSHKEGDSGGVMALRPQKDTCVHHHQNKKNIVGSSTETAASSQREAIKAITGSSADTPPTSGQSWVWFPSWRELTHHYFFEMGFLSSFIMFSAATIFWIVGFASLPGVYDQLSLNATYGVFWTPDILGSVGFVVASAMLMIETQPNWYTPAPHLIGWHANFWNLLGSVGFLLAGCFGVCSTSSSVCLYQSDLSTTWGSAAFLIGSVILWYESLDKYPVEIKSRRS